MNGTSPPWHSPSALPRSRRPPAPANAEDYWCGKGKNRIHLMMWIAKVQEPMRDDEGKLIRDNEGGWRLREMLRMLGAAARRGLRRATMLIRHRSVARACVLCPKTIAGTKKWLCGQPNNHSAAALHLVP